MRQFFTIILIFSFLLPVILTSSSSCPSGFTLVNKKKCLKVFSEYKKHFEAEEVCRGYGGTFATAHNAIDNRAIVSFASNAALAYFWMGMFCFGNQSSTCYHDDGSGIVKYSNFAPGNPKVDQNLRDGGCVYTPSFGNDAGKWYSGPCEWTGIEYLCEVPVTKNDTSCLYNYNGNCYFPSNLLPIPDVERDFYGVLNICHVHSMELLSIHSRREIDFLKSIYKNSGIVELTLGAHAYQKNLFDWTDGTNFDYDNFDPLSTTNGSCLQMDLSERDDIGMWYQTDCLTVKYFMCVRPAGGSSGASSGVLEKNPTLKSRATRFAPPKILDLSDSSNCNTTLLLAPGVITSLGYSYQKPLIAYCTWKVAVLGPYRLGLYFTDFSVKNPVNVYSENNTLLDSFDDNKLPFSLLAPSNLVTLSHDSANDGVNGYHGFSATVLPY